uniref:Growth hormone secretagogue receptor type 1 n=1 Tax=Astatotilapia calliptera TaxID=8154 RepID=A0A3P8PBL3_ASTCA
MRCQNKRRAPHKKLRRAFAYIRFSGGGQSLFRTLKDVEEAPLSSYFGFPPPPNKLCVTVIYIPLMLFGLLGNILTILVVWLRPHMRTSTYLYLSSMAVSDLLILLLLPLDLYKLWRPRPWPLGDLACKLTMFLSECCTFCTILHITFLSLERYLAVCWPITAKTVVTRRRTRAIIGCLWLSAAVSAAPVLVMVGVEDVGREDLGLIQWKEDGGWTETDKRECRCTHFAISSGLLSAMMILSNLYFLVPLCILGVVYSLIGRTLWLRPKSSRRDQSHRNTVKMLGEESYLILTQTLIRPVFPCMFVHGYINGCAYFPFFKTTYKKTEGWAKTFAYCSPCSTCCDWSGLDLERWRF